MKQISWIILGWIMLLDTAHAASFDCTKPSLTAVEKQICADSNLSGQDQNLATEYMQVRSVSTGPEREALKKEQQDWLENVRNKCNDHDCLKQAYISRIGQLSELYSKRSETYMPEDVAELSRQSGIAEDVLRQTLKDCGGGSRFGLQMCAFASFVGAELKMKKVLAERLASLPMDCRSWLQTDQKAWEKSRDNKCKNEASDNADHGMPGDFKSCQAAAIAERTTHLKSIQSCDARR